MSALTKCEIDQCQHLFYSEVKFKTFQVNSLIRLGYYRYFSCHLRSLDHTMHYISLIKKSYHNQKQKKTCDLIIKLIFLVYMFIFLIKKKYIDFVGLVLFPVNQF
jgi:hypothetical protein